MKRKLPGFLLLFSLLFHFSEGYSQGRADSLTDDLKNQIIGRLKNFSFRFYVDAYVNISLSCSKDTSGIVPFSSNCPVHDQIRMNVAAFENITSCKMT
ncbi:MAG: hypothetical protein WCK34_03780 [Bacteroidota bacterium]